MAGPARSAAVPSDPFCAGTLAAMDLGAEESGFPWHPMSKLEHQLVNLRHLQHHVGQLNDRLRAGVGEGVDWVGSREARG